MRSPYLLFLLSFTGCTDTIDQYNGQHLDLNVLQKTERIIPAKEGYLLLEVKADPQNAESNRCLFLYDKKGVFVHGAPLFGMVQKTGKEKIAINHTFNDYVAPTSIGFLNIDYTESMRRGRGGGHDGSFLVDSLKYSIQTRTVMIYSKKPKQQFVIQPSELVFEGDFMQPVIFNIPLYNMSFIPTAGNYCNVTSWEGKSQTYSTRYFYFKNKNVLDDLFQQVVNSKVSK